MQFVLKPKIWLLCWIGFFKLFTNCIKIGYLVEGLLTSYNASVFTQEIYYLQGFYSEKRTPSAHLCHYWFQLAIFKWKETQTCLHLSQKCSEAGIKLEFWGGGSSFYFFFLDNVIVKLLLLKITRILAILLKVIFINLRNLEYNLIFKGTKVLSKTGKAQFKHPSSCSSAMSWLFSPTSM